MKVLIFDIETAPVLAWVWGRFKQFISPSQVEREGWYALCASWKWLGEREVFSSSIPDRLKPTSTNDLHVIRDIRKALDEADVVVAHAGNRFDIPILNARFAYHGLTPPSTYRRVDTLAIAKREFRFPSNKLGELCKFFGLPHQKHDTSFDLWTGCLHGDMKAWKKMVKYCEQDVRALEELYLKLRPWDSQAPNMGLFTEDEGPACPKCGGDVEKRGWFYSATQKYQRYRCKKCGAWSRGRSTLLTKEKRTAVLANAR